MKYDLESLIETFARHANSFDITYKEHNEKFPDREKFEDDGFNISRALHSLSMEIKNIKGKC